MPMSPYSVSKISAEALCCQWSRTESFEIVTVRRSPILDRPKREVCNIKFCQADSRNHNRNEGADDPCRKSGYNRDLTDVRDVVRAYAMLLEKGQNGNIYNVCSGRETCMRTLLSDLIKLSMIDIRVEIDPSIIRVREQRRIRGCFEKLHKETGWFPEIPSHRAYQILWLIG